MSWFAVKCRLGRVNGSDAIRIMDSFVESVRLMNLAREERELRAAAAKIGTVCGDCDKWMKSRQCPKDRNVNGFNRGPSMVHPVCESFSPRPDHDERIARLTCDANRIRDEIEKSAGGA